MGHDGITVKRRERTPMERLVEGLTVAVASVLSFVLLLGPLIVFGTTGWHLVIDSGATTFSRFLVPMILFALVGLPLVLARLVFRSGRRKGGSRLTAAAPAALTLLGAAVVPLTVLCLTVAYAR